MREMKDSGIEWIGEIPINWQAVNPRWLFAQRKDRAKKGMEQYTASQKYGVISQKDYMNRIGGSIVTVQKDFDILKMVCKGDFVIHMRSFQGGLEYSEHTGSISSAYVMLIPQKNAGECRYFKWLFKSASYINALQSTSNLIRDGQAMRYSNFIQIIIPYPPLVEQQQIADYLDTKCSEIDATAEDIQKEIALLEDYKKSVITEAVTKGLNPDAEMKDSGIEWIGQIPKHWEVDKIKYHLKRNEPKTPGNAIVLSVYRDYGVIPKDSRDDNHNVTAEDTSKYKYVKKGQLVINKMKAWQGSLAVSDYDGIVSPAYFIYDFIDEEYNHKYFHYLVRSCYKDEFKRISGGIREGQWDLSPEGFSNTLVLLPSVEEQNEILDYILQKEMEIDTLIADKKRQLDILADYKRSLIYEYVTGKKEVPVNE